MTQQDDAEHTDFYKGYRLAKQYHLKLERVERIIGDVAVWVWIAASTMLAFYLLHELFLHNKVYGFVLVLIADVSIVCGLKSDVLARWIVRKPKVLKEVTDVER